MFFDDASVDRSELYDTSNHNVTNFSYSEEGYYILRQNSTGFGTILINDMDFSNNVKISYDVYIPSMNSTYNIQPRIGIWNNRSGTAFRQSLYSSYNQAYLTINVQYTSDGQTSSSYIYPNMPKNSFFTCEMIVKPYQIIYKILGKEGTYNYNTPSSNNKIGVQMCYTSGCYVYFKNLKVTTI